MMSPCMSIRISPGSRSRPCSCLRLLPFNSSYMDPAGVVNKNIDTMPSKRSVKNQPEPLLYNIK